MSDILKRINNVRFGDNVRVMDFVNLYGCEIGDNSFIGPFVEIQSNVKIGSNCKIQSHSFICEGVIIGNGCFIGHNVNFINDRNPAAINEDGTLKGASDWSLETTTVCNGASIGTGAVIMCGITIGERAMIGAGAVVTKDVPEGAVVVGNPAKLYQVTGNGKQQNSKYH